jgi:hypothetical protein
MDMPNLAEPPVIDLEALRGGDRVRVLAGRDAGREARRLAKIEALESAAAPGDTIEVRIPQRIISVTSSFFLGLFAESIRRLGVEGFRARYRFTGKPIEQVVEDAIRSVELTEPLR